MEYKPDTIKISASHQEEISASHADLYVAVKGSSLFSGDEALKKAKEVSELVEALTSFGLSPEAVHLQGIHIETSSGALLKSSSAAYQLKIQCEELEQIPDLLGIITSQKNVVFERIEWKYNEETAHELALEKAIEKAKLKAHKAASLLNVAIDSVFGFNEYMNSSQMEMGVATQAFRAKSADAPLDLGMDIHHSKTIEVHVEIEYRVSGMENK
jgi:uncharacterized protein YggE